MISRSTPEHHWKFFRAGGFDQVRLDTAEDLLALRDLDPKLWVALSCPVTSIDFPPETLALLDADADGHIRAPELLAAVAWCKDRLADTSVLVEGASRLSLAAIAPSEAGEPLLRSAKQILTNLSRPDDTHILVEDLSDPARIFGQTRFNGDGIITALSTDDGVLQNAIAAIGTVKGTLIDRSGEPGIDGAAITTFFEQARAWRDWMATRPAGNHDEAAATAYLAVREKISDYFTRCRMAAYDPRAAEAMNGTAAELEQIGRTSLACAPAALAALPLARAEAGRPLPLDDTLNPAWQAAMHEFKQQALPADVSGTLTEARWNTLQIELGALSDWYAQRVAPPLAENVPVLLEWLDQEVEGRLLTLVDKDLALADEAAGIDDVRKLLLFVRDLSSFANNFVSFRDFYTRKGRSMFQCGTLYIDGRSCDLVVPVSDVAAHGGLATLSKLYLVYCLCRRGDKTRHIAAAMTDGGSDQLMVGRNGVFIDRDGNDWDAQIVRLVEHPISLRQAFFAPYRRVARMVSEQVQKFAANRAAAAEQKAAISIVETATRPGAAPAPAAKPGAPAPAAPTTPPPFDVAKFAGIFAAIGLAVGAIGTAIASVITGFLGLKWWQMPLALLGILLIVSGPSLLIAWFKLKSRTLGPLLDANGWAINARAAINLPFGQSLTHLAKLPVGAERALTDPYAEKKTPWGLYATLAMLLGASVWALLHFLVK